MTCIRSHTPSISFPAPSSERCRKPMLGVWIVQCSFPSGPRFLFCLFVLLAFCFCSVIVYFRHFCGHTPYLVLVRYPCLSFSTRPLIPQMDERGEITPGSSSYTKLLTPQLRARAGVRISVLRVYLHKISKGSCCLLVSGCPLHRGRDLGTKREIPCVPIVSTSVYIIHPRLCSLFISGVCVCLARLPVHWTPD